MCQSITSLVFWWETAEIDVLTQISEKTDISNRNVDVLFLKKGP